MNVTTVFEGVLDEFIKNYPKKESIDRYFTERDIERFFQVNLFEELKPAYIAIHQVRVYKNPHLTQGWTQIDLAVLDNKKTGIKLAIEFKYEPDHNRANDFTDGKLYPSVVNWRHVKEDVDIIKDKYIGYYYHNGSRVENAVSIFVDEGGFHKKKGNAHEPARWENEEIPMLICKSWG